MSGIRNNAAACLAALLAVGAVQASGINGINGGMPNRISMNVTVPKQTQGRNFGEKVATGLQAAGSAVAQGASMAIAIECGQAACVVALPEGDGYRADLQRRRVEVLKSNKTGDPDANTARAIGQGASLIGAALPGGGIVSAAVSSVGNLKGGGGAASASYAATGRMRAEETPLRAEIKPDGGIDVLDPLVDGEYLLTVVVETAGGQDKANVAEKATSGLKDTLKTNVRTASPPRIRIVVGFDVENGVLKARHDTAKNSIGNIR